ncbi:MAG: AraC family transcriptional regulator [Lachnospiraceae bacterium]|nr:AraC family transcriptional regulator [Lachnospiraceae bacterium]
MNPIKSSILELLSSEEYKVYIRNAGNFRFPVGYRFAEHVQPEIEIVYMNSGECMFVVEGTYIPMKQGDCLIVSPFVRHGVPVEARIPYSFTQLEYSLSLPKELSKRFSLLENREPYLKLSSCQGVCNIMTSICRKYRQTPATDFTQTSIDLAVGQLFVELSDCMERKKQEHLHTDNSQSRADEIIKYINENFETDIRIEILAEEHGISSRCLRKYFEKETGMSCRQYITMLRIERAKELLWNSGKNITDIAMMTGFNSSQYFSRIFQKVVGVRPHEYRNMWRGKIADIDYTVPEDMER